jgi:hypothetical protein
MAAEGVEDDADVLQVLCPRGAIDQYVIKKHQHEPAEIRAEDVVHQCLESGWGVGEAERHHQKLVVPLVRAERRLADVVRVHPHLMIAGTQVQLREKAGAMDLVDELVHHRYGKLILGGLRV